jgi:hypothetical protein
MTKRGRKSAESLAIRPVTPVETPPRPTPPDELNDEEAEEWLAIVNRLPADLESVFPKNAAYNVKKSLKLYQSDFCLRFAKVMLMKKFFAWIPSDYTHNFSQMIIATSAIVAVIYAIFQV